MTYKTAEIHLMLVIVNDSIEGELLSQLIEIGATKSWAKGTPKVPHCDCKILHKNNGCEFGSVVNSHSVPIAEFWNEIKINETLLRIIEQHHFLPTLSLVIYSNEFMPSIHFDTSVIADMAFHSVEIDIDVILC